MWAAASVAYLCLPNMPAEHEAGLPGRAVLHHRFMWMHEAVVCTIAYRAAATVAVELSPHELQF